MRATPLTYEHEPRRVFWVVRDLRPDPRYILGIEVASRAQLPRCAPTGGPSYVPTAQRSVWERILASPARVCMYLKANNFVGKCNGRLPGRPAAIERAVVAAAHAGRRGPRACDFACAAAAWRSLRDRCARWRRRTRIPRGAFRSCVRTRARSRAPRRAPPSPWTTACARRPDSPRQPGTVPVPLDVPYAIYSYL